MNDLINKILQRVQRITKTDVRYLLRGGFWLVLGQGFRMLSGLVLLVAFANLLPKEVYGTYQFVMAAATILSAFTLSGMGSAITRATAQGNEGALRYGVRTKIVWSIGITFAAATLALYYFYNENNTLAVSFLIVGAFSPFLESFRLYRFYLRGKQQFKESELLGFARQAIPVLVMLVAIFLTQDPALLLGAYFASHTFAVGLVYFQVVHRYELPITKTDDMVNLSKHLSVLKILGMVASNLDKLLIFHFLGPAPVAAYVIAQSPVTHMKKVLSILTEMTIPKLSKRNFSELQKTLPRKVWLFLLLCVIVAGAYILIAPFLFGIFFPTYPESVLFTQAMALILLAYPKSIFGQAFKAHALKREIYLSGLCTPILGILFLVVLLPMYGIWGAVWAPLLAQLISNIYTRILFARAKAPDLQSTENV